ncbi:ABC transporter related protein [Desulfotomaculum nigrificans CO-1-SRB]|uniref:ABC transporter related protein n=1 Tax=Desulfotomaculum nigrificans (strain DSM 14880 / VKM B-2319 / CO-1-SRB) TaxID=868595 RepID=F6B4Y1_DESCC|nr:ABC transporter ATP-binding protein [Desulfotomaculum nigrificans]AEF95353.1 ABC transporter related protein [Desulfotomaculum nigrificans CO-1-SRB]
MMQPVIKAVDLVQVINKKTVLDGVNLEVFPGEALGIFGTRGTGKTTLLHILAGIDRFTSGTVEILGCDSRKSNKFKPHLSLVTQERSLFQELKVAENLDFLATLRGGSRATITQLVERLELTDILSQPVRILEAGEYQRAALACALLNNPRILIADELIKDIDLPSRRLIIKEVQRFMADGGTFICGFSNMDYACQMSRVAWLAKGRITWYDPAEARSEWQRQVQEFAVKSGEAND